MKYTRASWDFYLAPGCRSRDVIGVGDYCQSSFKSSSQSDECWWGGCSVPMRSWLCNTHSHAHTYNRAPKTTPAWWIPITYCCPPLIWQTEAIIDCSHPQITIRKMHSPRSSLRPEDTKDRCWAVKFLHLNPSRCHPLPPHPHPSYCANTSCFICLKFFTVSFECQGGDLYY